MTTDASSLDLDARSRKNYSMILNRLASVGQANVAAGLSVHESTISKMKDAELERFARLLALLGLKVVHIDMKCFPVDQVEALLTLAKARMKNMDNTDHLLTED